MSQAASAPPDTAHVPLAQRLEQLLAQEREGEVGALTLNLLLERTQGRGMYLVIILLCVPFIAPFTIPGSSIPFGLAIAFLGLEAMRRRPPRLPKALGDRPLPKGLRKLLFGGGIKFLRWIEKRARPRRCEWMSAAPARVFHGLLLAFWGLFLALPFPPFLPPLANNLPCYAILLLAVSLMEEDGALIRLAYALSLLNVVYFAFWADLLYRLAMRWEQDLARWLRWAA